MNAREVFVSHLPGIAEALERCSDARTVSDVIEAVREQRAQVWGDKRGLIITELVHPYVHFWIATGEMDAVIDRSHQIMEWASALGYTKASLTGRRGWVKALARDGWRECAVVLERNLNGENGKR